MATRGSLESESAMKLPAVEITFGLLLLTDLQGFPLISIWVFLRLIVSGVVDGCTYTASPPLTSVTEPFLFVLFLPFGEFFLSNYLTNYVTWCRVREVCASVLVIKVLYFISLLLSPDWQISIQFSLWKLLSVAEPNYLLIYVFDLHMAVGQIFLVFFLAPMCKAGLNSISRGHIWGCMIYYLIKQKSGIFLLKASCSLSRLLCPCVKMLLQTKEIKMCGSCCATHWAMVLGR